ncbi:MAG: hypothetical protein R6X02_10355, partial [Enhygromyxa sp.]
EKLAAGIERAADALAPAIAELAEQGPTLGKPIVTGFSQGGMLAFCLAVPHGELFSAPFPLGGWLPPPLWPKSAPAGDAPPSAPPSAPPIIAFHGDEDRAVKFEPTEEAVYRVQLNSYVGVGHAISPDMREDLFDGLRDALSQIVEH